MVFASLKSLIKESESDPESDPDPLVKGMDPWIRIRTKMSRIPNTDSGIGQYDVARLPQKWYHPPELDLVNDHE